MSNIDFTYLEQPPNKYTFQMPLLKQWTEQQCHGRVLNLFAGKTMLNVNEIRNDVDKSMPADYHKDAFQFIEEWEGELFDTIIFDPPYNLRKSREKYEGRFIGNLTKIKNILNKVLNFGGIVISFGYDSTGMGTIRGFKKVAICLVCHFGDHNDTICLVEKYVLPDLYGR